MPGSRSAPAIKASPSQDGRPRFGRILLYGVLILALAGGVRLMIGGELQQWQAARASDAELARLYGAGAASAFQSLEWARRLEADGKPAEARDAFRKATEQDAGSAAAWVGWGRSAYAVGEWRTAEEILARAVRQWPESADARFAYAAVLASTMRHAAAAEELKAGLRSRPSQFQAWWSLGNVSMYLENPVAAVAAYREAYRIQPNAGGMRAILGKALVRAGQPKEARVHLEAALVTNPADLDTRYYLAEALAQSADADERQRAILEYNRVAGFSNEKARAHLGVARIWLKDGDVGNAQQALEHAMDAEPNHLEALRALVGTYRKQGQTRNIQRFEPRLLRLEQADEHRRRVLDALQRGAPTVSSLLELGKTYMSMGLSRDARLALDAVLRYEPRNPIAAAGLKRLDEILNRSKKAATSPAPATTTQ